MTDVPEDYEAQASAQSARDIVAFLNSKAFKDMTQLPDHPWVSDLIATADYAAQENRHIKEAMLTVSQMRPPLVMRMPKSAERVQLEALTQTIEGLKSDLNAAHIEARDARRDADKKARRLAIAIAVATVMATVAGTLLGVLLA